jgi:hypothetical protein
MSASHEVTLINRVVSALDASSVRSGSMKRQAIAGASKREIGVDDLATLLAGMRADVAVKQ